MFRILRTLGGAALWIGAGLGVIAGIFWLATAAGLVQPLIVISGSMEPTIDTGDLLIATRADTSRLEVGDIVSLPSDLTHRLVTHRIVSITPLAGDRWTIEMKGDANPSGDIAPYVAGDQVWKPGPRLPGVGYVVSTLMSRGFVVPALFALVALLGFSLLSDDEPDEPDDEPDDEPVTTSAARIRTTRPSRRRGRRRGCWRPPRDDLAPTDRRSCAAGRGADCRARRAGRQHARPRRRGRTGRRRARLHGARPRRRPSPSPTPSTSPSTHRSPSRASSASPESRSRSTGRSTSAARSRAATSPREQPDPSSPPAPTHCA